MSDRLSLPVDFVACADAGPELKDHPGRRLCKLAPPLAERPRIRLANPAHGVSAEFCAACPYRREEAIELRREAPLAFAASAGATSAGRGRACRHEGPVVQTCGQFPVTDARSELRHRRICLHDGVTAEGCTRDYVGPAWQACSRCPHYAPEWPLHFDQANLAPHLRGHRFNASLIEWGDGHLLAWRSGWRGSDVFLSELDREFQPTGRHVGPLALRHAESGYGREDPRLFRHDGRLYLSFIGVVGGSRIRHTSQLYARLNDDLSVERVHYPHYEARNLWEKNWQPFSHDGVLYAVYRAAPHQVLRLEGDRAVLAFQTPWDPGWTGGEIRGGAAPVRVGDEYWCFFHDKVPGPRGKLVYRMGLYTFEARPPFRPRRIVREPLLSADAGTFRVPHDNYCDCVFPGGAVRDGADWVVAAGVHDRWAELHRLDHAGLDERLQAVSPAVSSAPAISGDVLVAALLTGGSDPFGSGGKVRGEPCRAGELTPAELGAYVAPFVATIRRWGVPAVVLHDGLPAEFVAAHPGLSFVRVDPAGVHNYERRWYAWRDWLEASPDVRRAWLVDVNDVYFTAPPFGVLEELPSGHVAAAVESGWTYAEKSWYADHLRHLPAEYADCLIARNGGHNPVNCGAWAADRPTALAVCRSVCAHLARMEAHAVARHPETPVVCDMIAFGRVLLDEVGGRRVHLVRMDGDPLIHDRPLALAAMGTGARSSGGN